GNPGGHQPRWSGLVSVHAVPGFPRPVGRRPCRRQRVHPVARCGAPATTANRADLPGQILDSCGAAAARRARGRPGRLYAGEAGKVYGHYPRVELIAQTTTTT